MIEVSILRQYTFGTGKPCTLPNALSTLYSRSTWCATGEMIVPEGFFRRMNLFLFASSTKYVGLLCP